MCSPDEGWHLRLGIRASAEYSQVGMDTTTTTTPLAESFAFDRIADVEAALARADSAPAKPTLKRVRYTHDAMIDLVIENPMISQNEIAEYFGYSVGWVSIVFNSDAFQCRLTQRKTELVDPSIRVSIRERFSALAARSLEVLQAKLAKDPDKIPDNLALKAAELATKGLGEGGFAPPAPPADHLATLASRLLALGGKPSPEPLELIYDEKSHQAPGNANQSHSTGPSDAVYPTGPEGPRRPYAHQPDDGQGANVPERSESGG